MMGDPMTDQTSDEYTPVPEPEPRLEPPNNDKLVRELMRMLRSLRESSENIKDEIEKFRKISTDFNLAVGLNELWNHLGSNVKESRTRMATLSEVLIQVMMQISDLEGRLINTNKIE